jgi:hypothetical protein
MLLVACNLPAMGNIGPNLVLLWPCLCHRSPLRSLCGESAEPSQRVYEVPNGAQPLMPPYAMSRSHAKRVALAQKAGASSSHSGARISQVWQS